VLVVLAGCGREHAQSPGLPAVISNSPANGATGVVVSAAVSVGFSVVMAPATINTSTFMLTGPGGAAVTGAVSYAGTIATFTPTSALAPKTVYVATVTTGAQDPTGASLAANLTFSFTTGTIPTVVSTNPLNGAINVPINQKITATFSEAMNSTTVTASGTFTLAVAGTGGAAVTGTVTYVAATSVGTQRLGDHGEHGGQRTRSIEKSLRSSTGQLHGCEVGSLVRFASSRHHSGEHNEIGNRIIATLTVTTFLLVPAIFADDTGKPPDVPKSDNSTSSTATTPGAPAKPKLAGEKALPARAASSGSAPSGKARKALT